MKLLSINKDRMNDKKILENGVVNFFSGKKEYRSLSNFWEKDVICEDRHYESGEHCFHGEKYFRIGEQCDDLERKQLLLQYGKRFMKPSEYNTGALVKRAGGKRGFMLLASELKLWNKLSGEVQYEICRYKVENYEEVRDDLCKSIGKILIHPAMRCSEEKIVSKFWEGKGIVRDGKIVVLGENRLGNIWMDIRSRGKP